MCLLQPSESTLPASYHFPRSSEYLGPAELSCCIWLRKKCSTSSYHPKIKIIAGRLYFQRNWARTWNCICARCSSCFWMATDRELCPAFLCTVLLRHSKGSPHKLQTSIQIIMHTFGHRNQQHGPGFTKSCYLTKSSAGRICLAGSAKTGLRACLSFLLFVSNVPKYLQSHC